MGSKEEHLDNLQAYNESLAETQIKLLLLSQFKRLRMFLNKTITLLALFHLVTSIIKY